MHKLKSGYGENPFRQGSHHIWTAPQGCEDYDAFLMYSRVSRIESLQMHNASDLNAPLAPIESEELLRDAIGLAFDYGGKRLFYSDIQRGSINAVAFDGTDHKTLLSNVGSVEGLVYDAHSETLFWTCNADNSIGKAKIEGGRSDAPVSAEKVVQVIV